MMLALSLAALAHASPGGADLLVATVDAAGRPMGGVPVALRVRSREIEHRMVDVARVETDSATGRAAIGNTAALRASTEDALQRERSAHETFVWSVQIESIPTAAGAFVEFDTEWPTSLVTLSTANLADLEVIAVDSQGQIAHDAFEVLVSSNPARFPLLSIAETDSWRGVRFGAHQRRPLVDGKATLRWIGAADRVCVFVRRNALSDWSGVAWRQENTLAPRRVQVELSKGLETIVFEPQLDGQSLPGSAVRARRTMAEDYPYDAAIDAAERQAVVDEWWTERGGPTQCAATWTEFHPLAQDDGQRLELDIWPSLQPSLDLLNVALAEVRDDRRVLIALRRERPALPAATRVCFESRPPPTTGLVVDRHDQPIRGAQVVLEEPYFNFEFPLGGSSAVRLAHTASDALGHFSFPCPASPDARITASAPGYFTETSQSSAEGPLRIVLRVRASLRGYIRARDSQATRDLNLLLVREDADSSLGATPGTTIGCSCDGLFEFNNVLSGRYTLVVRRAQGLEPPIELVRRSGIELHDRAALDLGEIALP